MQIIKDLLYYLEFKQDLTSSFYLSRNNTYRIWISTYSALIVDIVYDTKYHYSLEDINGLIEILLIIHDQNW
mgnify:CR=1 FL=1